MQKSCRQCARNYEITEEDFAFYKKVDVPEPKLCPDCREQRRRTFRNDRYFYNRKCDFCGKQMISLYDPEHTDNIYCNTCWWSDKWDPLQYGREYDFSRPFFEQFRQLWEAIPKITMVNDNGSRSINCEYTSDFSMGKNAYMVNNSWHVQDCMYGYQVNFVKDCVDNLYLYHCELMYETVFGDNSYGCQNCRQVTNSNDCIFGYDLIGCSDCILCAGLRNKKYSIRNKQFGKEEYFREKEELRLDSRKSRLKLQEEFERFMLTIPHKYANLINCEDCTGDNLIRSKNSKECYNFPNLFHCKFLTDGDGGKYSYDCNSTGNPELCYDCITPDNGYMCRFTVNCWNSQYLFYSENCHNASQYLFGCSGLKKAKYCILNKQYSKEEYEALLPKIINHMKENGEWGEFFGPEVTLFAYNESSANEYFPVSEDRALELGYRWSHKPNGTFGKETATEIPDSINDINQEGDFGGRNILREILACRAPQGDGKNCSKNYKITKEEFEFYKKHAIPIPEYCPDCRHKTRRSQLNPKKLWHRQCMCNNASHKHPGRCREEFETTYPPGRSETVYCEKCYLETVY